ncbi:MAG: glutathione S-transferase family protein [Pseudomonadota bacterium]
MKLYTYKQAPNPLRVHVFLAEKGISLPTETVDIRAGETRAPDFKMINSLGEVPVLELDDGQLLTESVAICRYLEALHPETPLMGDTPLETALIDMWTRRMEQQIMAPISQFALHSFEIFADKIEQLPDYAATQLRLQKKRWAWLDTELSDGRTFVAGDRFSVADITGMAALRICDFAKEQVPEDLPHTKRWERAVRDKKSWPA